MTLSEIKRYADGTADEKTQSAQNEMAIIVIPEALPEVHMRAPVLLQQPAAMKRRPGCKHGARPGTQPIPDDGALSSASRIPCAVYGCGTLVRNTRVEIRQHLRLAHTASEISPGIFLCGWNGCTELVSDYSRHVLGQTGHLRSVCGCREVLSRKDSLLRHLKTQAALREPVCCVQGCRDWREPVKNRDNLLKHMKEQHADALWLDS